MALSLAEHTCVRNCLEDNRPICHECMFTSATPVRVLPCGHMLHSSCFQVFYIHLYVFLQSYRWCLC
ncbi:putative transcription factor C2H2 family [Helianthus anomalus]